MEAKIEKLDNLGRGITYINNKICFVNNALPNEIVEIKIEQEHKKYIEATLIEIKEASPFRIVEECPYSNICGGCQLNHLCYNEENRYKKNKIKSLLHKYANIEEDKVDHIIYEDRNYYRNKITLHGKDGKLGLYEKKSKDIIPIQECILVNSKINETIKWLSMNNINITEAIIKTSNDESELMVSIKGEVSRVAELKSKCNVLIINEEYLSKDKRIETTISNNKYEESINSFFQVNKTLTESLYDAVRDAIKANQINTALDLYCGTGTITIYISDYCNKIIGIDNNPSNIKDANINKQLNNKENIEFICDNVENSIDKFKEIDLIVIDPPRSGLDKKTREYLRKIKPKNIIYVSCDPLTLSRDLNELKTDYNIIKVKPFNMFPRTYHCESITVLERR